MPRPDCEWQAAGAGKSSKLKAQSSREAASPKLQRSPTSCFLRNDQPGRDDAVKTTGARPSGRRNVHPQRPSQITRTRPSAPRLVSAHCPLVAQTSQSAVSQVSKPAGGPATRNASTCRIRATLRGPCRFGNRRYSRFGNLRYSGSARMRPMNLGPWLFP